MRQLWRAQHILNWDCLSHCHLKLFIYTQAHMCGSCCHSSNYFGLGYFVCDDVTQKWDCESCAETWRWIMLSFKHIHLYRNYFSIKNNFVTLWCVMKTILNFVKKLWWDWKNTLIFGVIRFALVLCLSTHFEMFFMNFNSKQSRRPSNLNPDIDYFNHKTIRTYLSNRFVFVS